MHYKCEINKLREATSNFTLIFIPYYLYLLSKEAKLFRIPFLFPLYFHLKQRIKRKFGILPPNKKVIFVKWKWKYVTKIRRDAREVENLEVELEVVGE